MAPVSVYDVAAYILQRMGAMTTMKLQKLVYYCQAWSLVWDDEPMFNEKIKAWANGPVCPDLYGYHKGMYTISNCTLGTPGLLSQDQKETIEAVLDNYGEKSSQWLSDLTHLERPWREARGTLPDSEQCRNEITLDSMAEYYSSLKYR